MDPAGIRDLAGWWGMSLTEARAVTLQEGFPAADVNGEWHLAEVEAWLDQHGWDVDPLPQKSHEYETDHTRWNVPWDTLAWWQKPVQLGYLAARGSAAVIVALVVLAVAILIALAALAYLYVTLTDQGGA